MSIEQDEDEEDLFELLKDKDASGQSGDQSEEFSPAADVLAQQIVSGRTRGLDFYSRKEYGRAKGQFKVAVDACLEINRLQQQQFMQQQQNLQQQQQHDVLNQHDRLKQQDLRVPRLYALISNHLEPKPQNTEQQQQFHPHVEIAKLLALSSLMVFMQAIDAKKALTSHVFLYQSRLVGEGRARENGATSGGPASASETEDAANQALAQRVIFKRRYQRCLVEAYELACQAASVCPLEFGAEFFENHSSLSTIPTKIRCPQEDDLILFSSSDSKEAKIVKAETLFRRFIIFHHSLKRKRFSVGV